MTHFGDLFPTRKPIIAMAHVPPLPGTPLYDAERGVDGLVEAVRADLGILLDGGVDAVMFCNEGDRPYAFQAGYDGVVGDDACRHGAPTDGPTVRRRLPVGPAGGPRDRRRDRRQLHARGRQRRLRVGHGPVEHGRGRSASRATPPRVGHRDLHERRARVRVPDRQRSVGAVARSVAVSSIPDAILVSGSMAGSEPDVAALREAREAVDLRTSRSFSTPAPSRPTSPTSSRSPTAASSAAISRSTGTPGARSTRPA